jgi:hypothetical protein
MIGVVFEAAERAAVEEFFQLFKTPWEPFDAERTYQILIATVSSVPECDARLKLIFRSSASSIDAEWGLGQDGLKQSTVLEIGKQRLPVYRDVLTFKENCGVKACVFADGGIAGVTREFTGGRRVLRLGYDLFKEVQHILLNGQPLQYGAVPTLDLHIDLIRQWILQTRVPLVEIPPFPAGSSFIVCLTHDIDFIGIRRHCLDHTMWGFLVRATLGALMRFVRGRLGLGRLGRCWGAVATLPLVYLGWSKDFWMPFEWYLNVEQGLAVTYYLIPFKRRAGERIQSRHPERRATAYDVSDLSDWIQRLQRVGCEIGVHGIDAWHSAEKGKAERLRVASATGKSNMGIRMHWLLADGDTARVIEEAGYDYDATVGYNEAPGYRAGTSQVYRPKGAHRLLELPLHIQDGALFYPRRLDLSEGEAWELCTKFIDHVQAHGGVLTILWHDRSHGPERYWGDFYVRLVDTLRAFHAWFGAAGEVVDWFRARRSITFERCPTCTGTNEVFARCHGRTPALPFVLRFHFPPGQTSPAQSIGSQSDVSWSGEHEIGVSALMQAQPGKRAPIRPVPAAR